MDKLFRLLENREFNKFCRHINSLPKTGRHLEVENNEGNTVLAMACTASPEYVQCCLDFGCSVKETFGIHGDTPLTWCARDGRPDCFAVLAAHALSRGVDPHAPNECGNTPLMIACCYGDVEMLQVILDFHPNPYDVDADGQTVMDCLRCDQANDRQNVKNMLAHYTTSYEMSKISQKCRF